MIEDWVAVFEKDFDVEVFLFPSKSECVRYWIKRFENGKIHTAVSTGNSYALKSFKFYDKDLNETKLCFSEDNAWHCQEIKETSLDAWGSLCFCKIVDLEGRFFEVRITGMHGFGNHSISQEFYFTALMIFLEMLYEYRDWNDLAKKNKNLFTEITERAGIPTLLFSEINQNYCLKRAQIISNNVKKSFLI